MGGLPLLIYIPFVSACGVLFAWLFNASNGSVLMCMLLHASVNFSFGLFGIDDFDADNRALLLMLFLAVAVAVVLARRISAAAA